MHIGVIGRTIGLRAAENPNCRRRRDDLVDALNDRMIVEPADGAPLPKGAAPVGAEPENPPLRPITKVYRMIRRIEDK